MDYRALTFWFGVAQWFFTIGTLIYVWLSNRQKATQKEIKDLDARLDDHEDRLTRSEERIKQLPHPEKVSDISVQLAGLDGDIKSLREEIRGVRGSLKPFTEAVTRIEGYLLNGGRQ